MQTWYKSLLITGLLAASTLQGGASAPGITATESDENGAAQSAARVKRLIAGKTFYFVNNYGHAIDGVDWKSDYEWGVVRFDANATRLQYREFRPGDEQGTIKVEVTKNGVKFVDSEDPNASVYSYLSGVNKNFLQWEDDGYTRFYKTKAAARTYRKKLLRLDRGFPVSLVGKTYYIVGIDTYEKVTVEFGDDNVTLSSKSTPLPYRVEKGILSIGNGEDAARFYLRRRGAGYIEAAVGVDNGDEYRDRTGWFRNKYGKDVADFNNDAGKLAEFFVREGLMGHKVTPDGRILGKLVGYWEAYGNEFHFSIVKGDVLRFMAFRLEGSKIYLKNRDGDHSAIRLYTDPDAADAFLAQVKAGDAGVDLEKLFVGKKLYWNAGKGEKKRIEMLQFLKNKKAVIKAFNYKDGTIKPLERFAYRIDARKHRLITISHGEREYHRIIDHGKNWIEIRESEGGVTYLYTNRLAAIDGVVNIDGDSDGDSEEIPYALDEGKVVFYDDQGHETTPPTDAWVGLTPQNDEGEYEWGSRMRCQVQSDGSFKDSCFIEEEYREFWDRALTDPDRLYQIVVFRNHIEPDEHHWDCGEDLYRYVGQDIPQKDWAQIDVTPDDYQDRSGEECR